MNGLTIVFIVLIILAVIVGALYYNSVSSPTTTIPTTTSVSNQQVTTVPPTSLSTTAPTTTVLQGKPQNDTLTISQVISSLGTGWTSVAAYNYAASNITAYNGSKMEVQGYGSANFSNGGEFLQTEWVQFQSPQQASNYVNASFKSNYPNGPTTTQKEGNATYYFYSGESINNGQAASIIYAYHGSYGVFIFNQGTAFPQSTATQLLSAQLTNLGTT